MYSQNNEEEIIVSYFKEQIGYFIDIGAYHPFLLSNTRRLYELGWHGTYIEPSLSCFKNFSEIYKNDDRIKLINKAVVIDDRKEIEFYDSNGDAVSTTEKSHVIKWESGSNVRFTKTIVYCMNILDVFNIYPKIDFLNIDVESYNLKLFEHIPDVLISGINMLCIEHDGHYNIIEERMKSFGFKRLLINPENIIMAK